MEQRIKYKTIILDDEDKALERMQKLCNRSELLEVIAAFTKPSELIEFVKQNEVDLAFLDIEIPMMSGLEVAEVIQDLQHNIDVVFVTAFDKYALDAFQVNAVGYLLKPMDFHDLEQQLNNINKKKRNRIIPNNTGSLQVQCMGGFHVYKNTDSQEKIKWRTSKAEELFALLIHNRGKSLVKDKIIDVLWPEMEYERASKNLHAISYYIREALQELGFEDVFIRSKGQYQVKVERLAIDVVTIESNLTYIPLKAIPDDNIKTILDLAKGSYFEGKDYSWGIAAGTWMQNKIDEISLIQAERLLNSKENDTAIDVLTGIIKRNNCNDTAYKLLIQTYIKEGNQNMARQWFRTYEETLQKELDEEPDEEVKKLFQNDH